MAAGTHPVRCQDWGAIERNGSYFNHWWGYTEYASGKFGWINAVNASGGVNDGGFGGGVLKCGTSPIPTYGYAPNSIALSAKCTISTNYDSATNTYRPKVTITNTGGKSFTQTIRMLRYEDFVARGVTTEVEDGVSMSYGSLAPRASATHSFPSSLYLKEWPSSVYGVQWRVVDTNNSPNYTCLSAHETR
jgi:hypothetical protein